jgi:hypothetical protein
MFCPLQTRATRGFVYAAESQCRQAKSKIKTLENIFEKKFSKPFKKLHLKPRRGFRKTPCSFISRDFNVLPFTNSREARVCVRGRARVRSSGVWGLKAPKVLPLPLPLSCIRTPLPING